MGGNAARVDIDRTTVVQIAGSVGSAINADATLTTVTRSVVTGPGSILPNGLFSGYGINAAHGTAVIENDTVSGFWGGVYVFDTAYLSSNTITGNTYGVLNTATCFSRGNNTIVANGTNVSGTITVFSGQ